MIVYFNERFMPKEDVRISPDDRGFLFGDGVYEVVRAYEGRLFRMESHRRRMGRSLRELQIQGPGLDQIEDVAQELLQRNDLEHSDAKLYVQITRGVAPRRHTFPDPATDPTVYATASPFQPYHEEWEHGVTVTLMPDIRWARCDIKAVALLPNLLANQRAKERGAYEAVLVRDGAITEGSHTNFCAVFDGELVTYPKCHYILSGIMREVVLELCAELDIPVRESPVLEGELREADELIVTGTTSEVMPVVQVDGWTVGDGKPGPVTRKLQRAFRELTQG